MLLIYPRWPKLTRQTEFHLPPHGPVVFAAELPPEVDVCFVDENLQDIDFDGKPDLVALSAMLTCQIPRAKEIAREFRESGVPVICGGIATQLHADEMESCTDSVFLGEIEGRFGLVLDDFQKGQLKSRYNFIGDRPDIGLVKTARRDILDRSLYNYRGVQMFDLVHASRGCRFNCFPCCVAYLGGREFRPRPIERVVEEMASIENNRLFVVDNSLAQEKEWLLELFNAIKPLKKKWCSHPVMYDHEVLEAAAEAGCWYVYQAIIDTSDCMRDRIKMLKDHGIAIEGTILLGLDTHTEDSIKELIDFLMENELDMAEFTILTPFPHSPVRAHFEKHNRLTSNNWLDYTCDKVVFEPKNMSADRLQDLYHYAWDTFYGSGGQQLKMANLFKKVIAKEMDDGTYRRYDPGRKRRFIKKKDRN